jgi:hypothetical protein
MSSQYRPVKPRSTKFGRRERARAINTLNHVRKVMYPPFWLAVVIICLLAVIWDYQVPISIAEGFRFEPARQVEPPQSQTDIPMRASDGRQHRELMPLVVAIATEQPAQCMGQEFEPDRERCRTVEQIASFLGRQIRDAREV